ncbi:negative elongation factor A-like isoform X1 [Artemia franciscana]|uniref:HDAg domain-containing protein n=1 Tax=Artemia franciscana TaxID=6661 RepID=A0AA88HMP2_ARTSF|nr:hypothetical protein QYM36_013510 [Artemia franciscana]
MANVRVSDTSLWLHNKLGTNNDTWSIGAIYSQLNQEVLRNIKECFVDLQPQVKLKLLLSFLEIPRRSLEEWRLELEEILEIAQEDGEPWVAVLAETLKTVPSTGSLNESICDNTADDTRKMIAELVADLRKLAKKQSETSPSMLPLECSYLNRYALTTSIGQLPQPVRHFTLKRKPKSQALRGELLQKSADLQNNVKKNPAPTVPLRTRGLPRKMTDTTPLKGIPSKFGFGSLSRLGSTPTTTTPEARSRVSSRPIAGKKEVGVKLLDINEQPLGYAAMKKRKKQQELEAAAKAAEAAAAVAPTTPEEKKQEPAPTIPTPDYAAGLLPPMTPAFQPPSSPPTPNYAPLPSPAATTSAQRTVTRITPQQPAHQQRLIQAPQQQQQHVTPVQQMSYPTVLRQVVTLPHQQQPQQQVVMQQAYEPQYTEMPPPPIQTQQPVIQQPPPQPQAQKKTVALMLTREQMQEAQEMFRNSNRVTRPEKALILGFMAGSRENPCPHLGNIVTIKLSEDEEIVQQPDGTTVRMVVETHFQMNYNLGEWKRIKKYKKLDPQIAGMMPATVTA